MSEKNPYSMTDDWTLVILEFGADPEDWNIPYMGCVFCLLLRVDGVSFHPCMPWHRALTIAPRFFPLPRSKIHWQIWQKSSQWWLKNSVTMKTIKQQQNLSKYQAVLSRGRTTFSRTTRTYCGSLIAMSVCHLLAVSRSSYLLVSQILKSWASWGWDWTNHLFPLV